MLTARQKINAIILDQFRVGPGHDKVSCGEYELFNSIDARQPLSDPELEMLIPGTSITMAFVIGLYEQQPVKKCPRPSCQTREFSTPATGGQRWYPVFYSEFTKAKLTLIVAHATSGSVSLRPSFRGHFDFLLRKTFLDRSVPRGSGSRMCGSSQANHQVCLSEPMNLASLRSVPAQKASFKYKPPRTESWQTVRLILANTELPNLYHVPPLESMCRTKLQSEPSKPSQRSAN